LDTAKHASGHAHELALELDSAAISKTKSQISGLVSEIAGLARSHRDPTSYATDMLPRLAQSMAATGAALWSVDHEGNWHAIHCYAMPGVLLEDYSSEDLQANNTRGEDSFESKIDQTIGRSLNSIDSLINPPPANGSSTTAGDSDSLQSANTDKSADTNQLSAKTRHLRPSAIHQTLLAKVHQERQPVLVPPGSCEIDQATRGALKQSSLPVNPTAMALIFAPVPVESSLGSWWLQVVQAPSGGIATQRGYLRFVAQIADLTADFLKTYRLREHQSQTRVNAETSKLLEIASARHASARPADILPPIIARIRDILECDQVFLVHRYHRNQSWQTLIASGMRSVKSQSDGSQAISLSVNWFLRQSAVHQQPHCPTSIFAEDRRNRKESPDQPGTIAMRFANAATRKKRPGLMQPDACENISRSTESSDEAILRFNAMFTSAITTWIPIFSDQPNHDSGVGLLVYWSLPSTRSSPEQLDRLLSHTQQVTSVVLQATRPSALAAWTGKSLTQRKTVTSRISTVLKSRMTIACLTAGCIIGVGFIPVQSHLISPATIVAAKQHRHYASSDATVRTVNVDYGQAVTAGQILIELEDRNLQRLFDQTEAEVRQIDQQIISLNNRMLRDQQLSESNRFALEGELDTLRKMAPQTAIRLRDLRKQIDALKIVAASDGVVTTWNASQSLQITKDTRGTAKPATNVSWNEAARFVNWLNTSTGGSAAYKFTTSGVNDNIAVWTAADTLDYNAANPYRSVRAKYMLPSYNEWYKAAYYSPALNGGDGGSKLLLQVCVHVEMGCTIPGKYMSAQFFKKNGIL
jgi:hypothetical protein